MPLLPIFTDFLRGCSYLPRALAMLSRAGLWGYVVGASAVNTLLFVALLWVGWYTVVPHVTALDLWLSEWAGDSGFLAGAVQVSMWLVWVLLVPAFVAVGMVALMLLGQAIAGPFLDIISERVEEKLLGTKPHPFTVGRGLKGMAIAIADLVWGLLLLVATQGVLLLLGLVPIVGTVPAAVLSVVASAFILSHELQGLPQIRRLHSYRQRWRHIKANRAISLGLGVAALTTLAVPLLNLALLPIATTAGTMLYCELERNEN